MRAPHDPEAPRDTADARWALARNMLVSAVLLAGMAFLGWDLVHYLLEDRWDWTTARDLMGDLRTGWSVIDPVIRFFLSLHMTVFCVIVAWLLGRHWRKDPR